MKKFSRQELADIVLPGPAAFTTPKELAETTPGYAGLDNPCELSLTQWLSSTLHI